MLMMQQSKLERSTVFVKAKLKTPYLTPLAFLNPTTRTPGMCFNELEMC
jgi:hypothetical protein